MTTHAIPYAEVIGDPVAHSKSPLIHKFWLAKLGIKGDYRATRVARSELADYLASRRADPNWRGCNVTMPHKQAVISFLDDVDDPELSAVNCVLPRCGKLLGRETDSAGVDHALSTGVDNPACIVGAGGAAHAAVASLSITTLYDLNVIVRDLDQGRRLLNRFGMKGGVFGFEQAQGALDGCFGLINASPLGMTGCPPMPEAILRNVKLLNAGAVVFDMVYSPLRTDLLCEATRLRLEIVDGLTMLIGQASYAFFHFFGSRAPSQHEQELRELLTR